tara:strand:- start:2046 stop:2516 length:471 start_codon:yes stop_codon:yes gene_type:complete
MFHKFLKILFVLSVLSLAQNCGYQPLLSEKNQKFSIDNFSITGDKKLGRILANKFNKIENAENKLTLKINAIKTREISSKSTTGSTTEYNIKIDFNIEAISDLDNKSIFSKTFSESSTFKASTLHVDTLNREKKIIESVINTINDELTRQLNLIYN